MTRTVHAPPTLCFSSPGTRWSAKAQSWPRTSWCPPLTPRTSTVCFKVTSCCSAVRAPTLGTGGSAPAGTSSRARWLSAKTVSRGHQLALHTLCWEDSGSSPLLAEPGGQVSFRDSRQSLNFLVEGFDVVSLLLWSAPHSGVFTKTKGGQASGREPDCSSPHNFIF